MLVRLSALLPITALVAAVAAAPNALEARQSDTECPTGYIECCDQTYEPNDPTLTTILGILGVILPDVAGLVGLGCSPITGVGTGSGATCTQSPVCCFGNTDEGLIAVGCSPFNLNA